MIHFSDQSISQSLLETKHPTEHRISFFSAKSEKKTQNSDFEISGFKLASALCPQLNTDFHRSHSIPETDAFAQKCALERWFDRHENLIFFTIFTVLPTWREWFVNDWNQKSDPHEDSIMWGMCKQTGEEDVFSFRVHRFPGEEFLRCNPINSTWSLGVGNTVKDEGSGSVLVRGAFVSWSESEIVTFYTSRLGFYLRGGETLS